MKKNRYLSLGIMSGTSNDGIDLSLIQSDGISKFDVLSSKYIKYNSDLVRDLYDLTNNINKLSIYSSRIIQIQDRVTKSYIDAIKKFKKSNPSKIDLISLHGQTIFHDPYKKISIQLCNAELIKSEFNSHIVYDFRQNDLKYGGQGAPLVPVFHKLMNNNLSLSGTNAFLNIGGVSNITIIENDLVSIFEKNGIRKIETKNKKFDPNFHQAMSEIEDNKADQGTILQEIQAGYMLGDRLLRPALVGVAKKKEENIINSKQSIRAKYVFKYTGFSSINYWIRTNYFSSIWIWFFYRSLSVKFFKGSLLFWFRTPSICSYKSFLHIFFRKS